MPVQFRIGPGSPQTQISLMGCLPVFIAFALMCLIPLFLYDAAHTAMMKLGLSPLVAMLTILGIVLGSMINLPVYRIHRDELVPEISRDPLDGGRERTYRRILVDSVIAVNVGGCVIPVLIALGQLVRLMSMGPLAIPVVLLVTSICAVVCWRIAQPIAGVGILMHALIPPLVSVGLTWLLLPNAGPDQRAATAFCAGVAGPLIGADLLNLPKVLKTPTATLSFGGAGSFDGIVLSGVLAAFLA